MSFNPYLFFSGNCREAMTRYQEIFGGQLDLLAMADVPEGVPTPSDQQDLIMHSALVLSDGLLMASDDPTGDAGAMKGISVSVALPDVAETERVFKELSDGGVVTLPISETFFSPAFGMCIDRFGVPWMVNTVSPDAS
jgi:PhnB protein